MNFPATWDGSQTATGEISRHHDPTSARSLETAGYEERQRILILNPDYVTLRTDLMDEEKYTPRTKILALMIMFSVVIFLNVMVGGGAYKSPWGIRCGGVSFWTVNVIIIAVLLASAWAAQTYVVARHEIKELVRFDYVHGDIIWNAKSAVLYPLIFVSAGLFAGTLGKSLDFMLRSASRPCLPNSWVFDFDRYRRWCNHSAADVALWPPSSRGVG